MDFKVGDRVEIANGEKARATEAEVCEGQKGVVITVYANDCKVNLDNCDQDPEGEYWPWSIPKDGLRLIESKK